MLDRAARNQMASAIRLYLDEQIGSNHFDELIENASAKTKDETVKELRLMLWGLYSDLEDHKIRTSKQEWDYIYRILLLIESNGEFELSKKCKWDNNRIVAAAGVIIFTVLVFYTGWGYHLLLLSIPFGLLSFAIAINRRTEQPKPSQAELRVIPFNSIKDIFKARRQVTVFKKRPYPLKLKPQKIEAVMDNYVLKPLLNLQSIIFYLFFGPLPLLLEVFSKRTIPLKAKIP